MRLAAIDIGTVTCRMLVADVQDGRLVELAKEYAITNLGEGVDATGLLKPQAMQRVACALDGFLRVLDGLREEGCPPIPRVVMATSASRDAENAHEFAALLAERGVTLAVIPGEREAALSFLGASGEFEGERIMVVDIGGGSTEVVLGRAGAQPWCSHSFNVGCRRVTERFLHADPPTREELDEARAWVRSEMAWFFEDARSHGYATDRVVAVAGTATSVVSVRDRMQVYDSSRVHKAVVSADQLGDVFHMLSSVALAERQSVVGLDPRRAPVIVAGLLILQEVLELAQASGFTASEADILQGIIRDAAYS